MIRTLICGGQVSLCVMDTTRLVNDAISIHGTDREASSILGGLLTAAAYIASSLKTKSSGVSLTVKAERGDGAVSVSCDSALHVRGYADGSCTRSLRGGILTVVREDPPATPYVGTCGIDGDDLSDIVEKYYGQSEQIPTAVSLCCDIGADGSCLCAGGVIMQLMPDADEEAQWRAGEAFENFKNTPGALLDSGAEGVMEKFFSALGPSESYTLYPEYKCNCSEEKIISVLAAVGKEELLEIARELGVVSVHCHYCNKDYLYDEKKIKELF